MPASIQPELSALRSDLVRLELKCASLASIPSRLAKPVLKVPPALQAFYAHDHPPQRSNSVAVATFMDLVDRLRACRDDSLAYFDTLNQLYHVLQQIDHIPPKGMVDLLLCKLDSLAAHAIVQLTESEKQDFQLVCNAIALTCDERPPPHRRRPIATTHDTAFSDIHHTSNPSSSSSSSSSTLASPPDSPGQARRSEAHRPNHIRPRRLGGRALSSDLSDYLQCQRSDQPSQGIDGFLSDLSDADDAPLQMQHDHRESLELDLMDDNSPQPANAAGAQAPEASQPASEAERASQERSKGRGATAQPRRGPRKGSSTYYRQDRRHRNHNRAARQALVQNREKKGRFGPVPRQPPAHIERLPPTTQAPHSGNTAPAAAASRLAAISMPTPAATASNATLNRASPPPAARA